MITGILAPSEGTIEINGKDIQKDPLEAKRHDVYHGFLSGCKMAGIVIFDDSSYRHQRQAAFYYFSVH